MQAKNLETSLIELKVGPKLELLCLSTVVQAAQQQLPIFVINMLKQCQIL